MTRYAEHTYKEPFACFHCRKVFKQTSRWELTDHVRPAPGETRIIKCPQCARPMADIGRDFKAPPQKEVDGWKKVEILFQNGFTFHSCGCCGPGYRPGDLNEVYNFIESQRPKSDGERLLERIAQRKHAADMRSPN